MMLYTFTGKNFKITDNFSSKIEEKMDFLKKYFIMDDNTEAHVTISYENGIYKSELMVFSKAGILKSEERDRDLNNALEIAVNKLEKQITRNKERLNRRHKSALAEAFIEEVSEDLGEDIVVKTKSFTPQAMELEDAILQMEMLGHSFYVYLDQESEHYAVVYKRLDNGYGLIEIEE